MKENKSTSESIKTVSFFCGCGGLDLGFLGGFKYKGKDIEKTQFSILQAYDNNPLCIETYHKNISPNARVLDLLDYDVEQIPVADVLIGGFPCQDFSTCGPRRGLSSSRGNLYKAMIKYAEYYKPKIVLGENVPGLANIDSGKVLEIITGDLAQVGYTVKVWRMFAPDYGIPQRRTRLIIVGVRNDLAGFPKEPEKSYLAEDYRTTRWAISDLETITDESVPNQSQYFKASRAKKGNGQGDEVSPADAPSYTIRANAKSRVQFHYKLNRRLTVRECARLQTFPDTFKFEQSMTSSIMQIGNAVPPLLGNLVARTIQSYLEGLS